MSRVEWDEICWAVNVLLGAGVDSADKFERLCSAAALIDDAETWTAARNTVLAARDADEPPEPHCGRCTGACVGHA